MIGFFKKEVFKDNDRKANKIHSCLTCGLCRGVISPNLPPYGNFKKGILIIGGAPCESDDKKGKLWQDKAGKLLKNTLDSLGIDLFEDCLSITAVGCRLPEDHKPTGDEIACCRDVRVLGAVKENLPQVVILLGDAAVLSFIGNRWKKRLDKIEKWRGWAIPDKDYKAWVCPTFNPSFVLQKDNPFDSKGRGADEVFTVWKNDLAQAVSLVEKDLPRFKKAKIHRITDLSPLNDITSGLVSIDYETTGLKPHMKGHRIVCASVAYDANNAFTFMMPSKKSEREPFIKLLQNQSIDKIAANIKFEDHWSNIRLKTEVSNWIWDTMQAAHVRDNRAGISSVKFQAYALLGVIDYDSDVAPYLMAKESEKKKYGANAINRIMELMGTKEGRKQVLNYCALDSIYEYRIALIQMEAMEFNWLPF